MGQVTELTEDRGGAQVEALAKLVRAETGLERGSQDVDGLLGEKP